MIGTLAAEQKQGTFFKGILPVSVSELRTS